MTAVSDVSRLHYNAMIAMLQPILDPPTSYQLYPGKVTVPDSELTYPYLVAFQPPGLRNIINFSGTLSELTTTMQLIGVGQDETAVLMILDRAAELLHGKRPTIAGRYPGLVRQVTPDVIPMPDSTINTPAGQETYEGVLQFQLNSTAASAA